MHEPSGLPRVDLISIKERLKQVLKDQATHYWELLRKFVQAKLSKKEFDYLAKALLGEEHISLHNMFIRSILSNARCAFPPVVSQSTRHKRGKALVKESAASTNAGTPQQPSAGGSKKLHAKKKGAAAAAAAAQKTSTAGGPAKPPPKSKPSATPRRPIAKEVPLGPEYTVLRQRMQRVATEAGLTGLTHDSIRVMMTAVEIYVKRVIQPSKPLHRPHPPLPSNTQDPYPHTFASPSTITYTTKCTPLLPSPPAATAPLLGHILTPPPLPFPHPPSNTVLPPSSSPAGGGTVAPRFNTITLQDLHKTAILHPSLFGEDFLVNQERVAISLM